MINQYDTSRFKELLKDYFDKNFEDNFSLNTEVGKVDDFFIYFTQKEPYFQLTLRVPALYLRGINDKNKRLIVYQNYPQLKPEKVFHEIERIIQSEIVKNKKHSDQYYLPPFFNCDDEEDFYYG